MKKLEQYFLLLICGCGAYWLVNNDHGFWACLVAMLFGWVLRDGADPAELAKLQEELKNPPPSVFLEERKKIKNWRE
jgi:hypothetical protein